MEMTKDSGYDGHVPLINDAERPEHETFNTQERRPQEA